MKGSETKFVAYMQGASKRFVIPVYQRNYDWKTENCKQLFDDLVKVIKNKRKSHFFGSVVSVHNPDGVNEEFLVIDGQQRLTTVSLLLLAIHNLIERKIMTPKSGSLSERIYEEYLVDKWSDQETRIKLKPVKNDRNAFGKLFEGESDHIKDSNLTINYNYFLERIQKEEVSIDELYEAICRLEIISIRLNSEDNPQLIFESLNSTGVALSEGDKIRNFIIMGLPTKQQNQYYEKYWNRIEVNTEYDVSSFIRDYLSVKRQTTPAFSKIYFMFKEYVEDEGVQTEDLLKDLLSYSKNYEVLLKGTSGYKEIDACINRLNRLETTVTRPFFLEILRMWKEEKLNVSEVSAIFLMTENYLFRRSICDLPTNVMNKVFLLLHKEIMRFDGTNEDYFEKFKFALLAKKDRVRFPDDDEFAEALETRQVYQMNSKNKTYILERFENFGTKEDKDVYRHLEDGTFSIEHIMPQHLTPDWAKKLGPDYEEIHEIWIHRLANLTLTAYNSKYSNVSFDEKKGMRNGFKESGIRMNQYIAMKEQWTLVELEERSSYLKERALEIWKSPVTEYVPKNNHLDTYTLEDDVDLTGRFIQRFSFKNVEQPVTSWIDMFEKVVKILHEEDKSVLSKLVYHKGEESDVSAYFSIRSNDLRASSEIDRDIYVEKNTSTGMKITLLRRLFTLFEADCQDLVFYLKEQSDTIDESLLGTRYETRLKYWGFALEKIKESHGIEGTFKNVNPSKDNWINGFIGVSGFYISCVANFNEARVEVILGKPEKEKNKAAFDILMKSKDDIENALGVGLVWARSEDIKTSRVYVALNNVSISNENDWIQMAKFHAEWSKKFFDVFVPILRKMELS